VVSVFAVLALIGPLLLLATTVVGLWSYGPLGWVASVLLVASIAWATRWTTRLTLRWWRSTKAPVRRTVSPAEARRAPR
jgi:hypothetical protein